MMEKNKKKKIAELQKKIDEQGAGFKKTEPKPLGRNARAFTNQARARSNKPPIKTKQDELIGAMEWWRREVNPALKVMNKTQQDPMRELLKLLGNDWKTKIKAIMNLQLDKYSRVTNCTTPKAVFENWTNLKMEQARRK
jgi:hypothetical protein